MITPAHREKKLIILAVLTALGALVYTLIIEPVATHLIALEKQATHRAADLAHKARLVMDYREILSEYNRLRASVGEKKGPGEEMAGVLIQIDEIARHNALDVTSLKPQNLQKMTGYREALVEVSIGSTISQLAHFLYDIEGTPALMRVRRFNLLGSNNEKTIKCNLLISKIFLD